MLSTELLTAAARGGGHEWDGRMTGQGVSVRDTDGYLYGRVGGRCDLRGSFMYYISWFNDTLLHCTGVTWFAYLPAVLVCVTVPTYLRTCGLAQVTQVAVDC